MAAGRDLAERPVWSERPGRSTTCQIAKQGLPPQLVLCEDDGRVQVHLGRINDVLRDGASSSLGCRHGEDHGPPGLSTFSLADDD